MGLALVAVAAGATVWFYFGANPLEIFSPKQESAVSVDEKTEIVGGGEAGGSFEFQTVTGRWGDEPATIDSASDSDSESSASEEEAASVADSAELNAFAQCLTGRGLIMYGAYWCPHCTSQKALFGEAFSGINYVECAEGGENAEPERCATAGIAAYPTWIDAQGTSYEGEQSLADLAEISACELPS
jgi:hypothetical protein